MKRKFKDLSGKIYGRLTVIERDYAKNKKDIYWKCQCSCGSPIKSIRGDKLKNGDTQSCGCLRTELKTLHGDATRNRRTRLYKCWCNIKSRCNNPADTDYMYYGGRGISICQEWETDFSTFKTWAICNGYENNLTIERKENSKGYNPLNCYWIHQKEQSKNKRNNILITYNDQTKCLAEWCVELNLKYSRVRSRLLRGWSIYEAFTTDKIIGRPRR